MSKHGNSDRSAAEGKRQKKFINFELDMIIKRYACNKSTFDIANARRILEST
jgi:hypothetical protein